MTLQVSSVPPLNVQSVIVMAISMPTMDAKLMPIAVLDAIILADQYFNLAQLSDNLFGLVSLDSHHLLLRLLTIPVDQSMGGGSVRSKMAPILINKTRRSEELGFFIYDNSRIYFYIYYVGLRKNNYFL